MSRLSTVGGITNARLMDTCAGSIVKLQEKQRSMEPPNVITIDYEKYRKEHRTLHEYQKGDVSDRELMETVKKVILTKCKNGGECFNKMLMVTTGVKPHEDLKKRTVAIRDFMDQLKTWRLDFNEDQLGQILAKYEDTPGEGLDYNDFCDILSGEDQSFVTTRRLDHTQNLETQKAKPISRSTASNVLATTSASVPQGKYAQYDRTIPLYGCNNGLDINSDGTNNGFFVTTQR
eukprot:TRINITY_DN21319_c0_g1_i1.p1 TRINITY_DN21319_c0_g1~~TRINITY_DN21319_c0_g1_i1.p1  ORF type:complete len:243 (+),score=56.28 TRINITY_DN21319_c0_g1_i1:31-729(+)